MNSSTWIAVVLSALLSFGVAKFFDQPLDWYLFILILFIGFFINTVILILKYNEEHEA